MVKPLLLSPAVLLLALLSSPAQQKTHHKPAAKPAEAAAAEPATVEVLPPRPAIKQIYKYDCTMCHGENGNGKTDMASSMKLTMDDWTVSSTLSGKTDQELFDIIRKGKGQMPAEDASRAKDGEIRELVKYIRSMSAHAPAAAEPAATPTAEPAAAPAPAEKPEAPSR